MRTKTDTILALDPGLRELGYAVLSGKEILTHGVLPLRDIAPSRRFGKVRESLEAWMRAYRPHTVVVEHIPRRPLDSLAGLPALGRLLRRLARRRRVKLLEYSVKAVRKSVVGDGWAGKADVARAVARRFSELRIYLTQDRKGKVRYWQNMYDAVALALHHQRMTQPPSRSRSSD
jgi:Holliday junction resolvasome RuvABC endonuclease subunit